MTFDPLKPPTEEDTLNEMLARLCVAQKRWVAPITPGASAVRYFFHWQGSFPYFTNRLTDSQLDEDSARDLPGRVYTLESRLVIAHLGTGFKGEKEALLYRLIPLVEAGLEDDPWLLDAEGNGIPGMDAIGLVPSRSRGLTVFQTTGIKALQVGTHFIHRVTFVRDKYEDLFP
jgi:hypothetical protein